MIFVLFGESTIKHRSALSKRSCARNWCKAKTMRNAATTSPLKVLLRSYVVIPARLKSTRLPRKLLLNRTGKPLIQKAADVLKDRLLGTVLNDVKIMPIDRYYYRYAEYYTHPDEYSERRKP